jgi:hypothetical protein
MIRSLLTGTALALVCALAVPANATLQIASLINGTSFFCADGQACDLDTNPGFLQIGTQNFSGVSLSGSLQEQQVATGNFLNTSSLQLLNQSGAAADVTVAVGGTGFAGPVTGFTASGSATFQSAVGSTLQMKFYGDITDQQGADTANDTPGSLLADSGVFTATKPTDSTNFNASGPFADLNDHSLTLWASGTVVNGGRVVSRGQTIVTTIPEPATLGLLGISLLGFVVLRRQMRPSA